MSIQIAMDLGTSYTSIYKQGEGLVLREPTVAAIRNERKDCFFGLEAKKLIGKTTENISIIFPIFEGVITSEGVATELIKYFLDKVIPKSLLKQHIKLLMTVPCGILPEEKRKYEEVAEKAGIREVFLIDLPAASAFGLNEYFDNYSPLFIADIGGGCTDIAVFSMAGIINGCTLGIGGNNIDTGIIDYIIEEYGIKTGLLTAEKIKVQIGSLYPNDNTSMMINGREADTGNPVSMLLTSKSINSIIEYYYSKILDVAESVLKSLPPEISGEIREKGLFICGGGAQVPGLDKYFYKRLQIPVMVVKEPVYTCILGAGKILSDNKLLNKLTGIT